MAAFTLDEIKQNDGRKFDTVEAYGGEVRIGTLSSRNMIAWLEMADDPIKMRERGLRLLIKSIVGPDGAGVPEDQEDAWLAAFREKDSRENSKVIAAALKLNGLTVKAQVQTVDLSEPKNESGEANTGASPTGSASPQDS